MKNINYEIKQERKKERKKRQEMLPPPPARPRRWIREAARAVEAVFGQESRERFAAWRATTVHDSTPPSMFGALQHSARERERDRESVIVCLYVEGERNKRESQCARLCVEVERNGECNRQKTEMALKFLLNPSQDSWDKNSLDVRTQHKMAFLYKL